jgi:hypothetical protein
VSDESDEQSWKAGAPGPWDAVVGVPAMSLPSAAALAIVIARTATGDDKQIA